MSDQLKPCPFCGGEAEFVDAQHATVGVDTIWCTSCGCRMVGKKCREQWYLRPSFVVPSVSTIEDIILDSIRTATGEDPSMDEDADAWLFATAIHSHLLASGARESVAWEALERIVKTKLFDGQTARKMGVIAAEALATRKEGA